MTTKISITLDDDIVRFIDSQGDNRSKTINDLLVKAQQEKLKVDLKAAYIDQNKDPHFWSEFELWDSTIGDGLDEEA
ncbi:MAG: type II toxin-antitoxin system MazE family antitoxin [Waterburya sp.]